MRNPDYELASWLQDHYLATGVNLVWEAVVLVGLYALLILAPRIWWLIAPLGGGLLGIAYAYLAPIWINPLFNDFTPLQETKWSDEAPRVQVLIDKAEIPVAEILVMNASRQSNHTNAYFAGFGATRRIVLYDTLLKKHTPDEIESVLAHEIGHWQHDHIAQGLLLGTIAVDLRLLGAGLLFRVRAVEQPPWHLQSTADPAGLVAGSSPRQRRQLGSRCRRKAWSADTSSARRTRYRCNWRRSPMRSSIANARWRSTTRATWPRRRGTSGSSPAIRRRWNAFDVCRSGKNDVFAGID